MVTDCNYNKQGKLSVNEIILMCFYMISNNRLNEVVINYNWLYILKYCYVYSMNNWKISILSYSEIRLI